MATIFEADEVAKHNTPESCWVVLYGDVYDVTDFLSSHPGGTKIILKLAGKDATEEYDPVHPPGTLEENLRPEAKLGRLNPDSVTKAAPVVKAVSAADDDANAPVRLETLLNLDDMEAAATKRISTKAHAYYFSAGDDLWSKSFNNRIRKYCPEVLGQIEVWVDGGIKRGTDIVKALCLGATAVGIGRGALYGLGAGGQAGVERTFEILQAEMETCMRLLGAKTVAELGPRFINSRMVERDIYDGEPGLDKGGLWTKSKL
ncbi:Diacylglycerol O-acyltransferase 2A [Verticillium dahliae VDG2]|nr:Diacylglycerol O-acyltransferase 2A [Verticillium dahliae VDG2]